MSDKDTKKKKKKKKAPVPERGQKAIVPNKAMAKKTVRTGAENKPVGSNKAMAKKTARAGAENKPVGSNKALTNKVGKTKAAKKPVVSSEKVVKKSASKRTYENTSATLRSIERQKRLEQTLPLGNLTAELPVLGRGLDAPETLPWKQKSRKQRDFREFGRGLFKKLGIMAGVVLGIVIAAIVVLNIYTVDTVIIEGNAHYTNDEIYSMVMGESKLSKNSLYLSFKYKNKDINTIPFIQTMNVEIIDASTIKITVYEKAVAGFVEYMGRYFYFDKDGTVIESSDSTTKGVLQVMGLDFDHIILYEKLPVESDDIFKQILDMTRLLEKYDIEMDKLYFDSSYNMTLYLEDARIKIGDFTNIDKKIIKFKSILPDLKGKKGVLRLDTYDGSKNFVTFEEDK